MSTAVVPGSLAALAQRDGKSLAETFLSADAIVIVDTSGSMASEDSRGGKSRYMVACEEMARLQGDLPGKVAVVSFSDAPRFEPSGTPFFAMGSTDLAAALKFVAPADGTVKFIVVSDGCPDSEADALAVARTFTSTIDTVFVGPETDYYGRDFLRRLAESRGGRNVLAEKAAELAERVETLMLKAG